MAGELVPGRKWGRAQLLPARRGIKAVPPVDRRGERRFPRLEALRIRAPAAHHGQAAAATDLALCLCVIQLQWLCSVQWLAARPPAGMYRTGAHACVRRRRCVRTACMHAMRCVRACNQQPLSDMHAGTHACARCTSMRACLTHTTVAPQRCRSAGAISHRPSALCQRDRSRHARRTAASTRPVYAAASACDISDAFWQLCTRPVSATCELALGHLHGNALKIQNLCSRPPPSCLHTSVPVLRSNHCAFPHLSRFAKPPGAAPAHLKPISLQLQPYSTARARPKRDRVVAIPYSAKQSQQQRCRGQQQLHSSDAAAGAARPRAALGGCARA